MGAPRRRHAQRLRHRLQRRRRTLHLRQRHGMGPRPPVVSPHARASHRARGGIRLPRRLRKNARLLPRHAPRGRRYRPRLPHRRQIRHPLPLPAKIPQRILCLRLDLRPHPRRPHARKGRNVLRLEPTKKHHLPQRRRVLRRRRALRRGERHARHRRGVSQRRQHGLHHRRPRHERRALSGELWTGWTGWTKWTCQRREARSTQSTKSIESTESRCHRSESRPRRSAPHCDHRRGTGVDKDKQARRKRRRLRRFRDHPRCREAR